ncbi:FadR/GntR family transcriptional regulator [Microlunatus panaciterrae]
MTAGAALPSERVLCERYRVSRPFLREVLSGLQQRGRIDIVPGRGAFVRDTSAADVARVVQQSRLVRDATPRELIEARATLERQTVMLAATRATAQDLESIERALAAFDRAPDLLARARADIAFHALIARASKNAVLELMFGSVSTLVFEVMLRSLGDAKTAKRGTPHHARILDALRARDVDKAVAEMSSHIHLAERTYGSDLDQSLKIMAADVLRRSYGRDIVIEDVVSDAVSEFQEHHTEGTLS